MTVQGLASPEPSVWSDGGSQDRWVVTEGVSRSKPPGQRKNLGKAFRSRQCGRANSKEVRSSPRRSRSATCGKNLVAPSSGTSSRLWSVSTTSGAASSQTSSAAELSFYVPVWESSTFSLVPRPADPLANSGVASLLPQTSIYSIEAEEEQQSLGAEDAPGVSEAVLEKNFMRCQTPPRWRPTWLTSALEPNRVEPFDGIEGAGHNARSYEGPDQRLPPRLQVSSPMGERERPFSSRQTTPSRGPKSKMIVAANTVSTSQALVAKVLNQLLPMTSGTSKSERSLSQGNPCRPRSGDTSLSKAVLGLVGARRARRSFDKGRPQGQIPASSSEASPSAETTLTLTRPCTSEGKTPSSVRFEVSGVSDCAGETRSIEAEVVAFRSTLSKSYGNLTRAFRAMKSAAGAHHLRDKCTGHPSSDSSRSESRLTFQEFEWCVIAYLHYGDRRLARRLFAALDRDRSGMVGLWELAQPPAKSEGLVSLIELRRRLLERHASLPQVFREFEEFLETQTTFHHRGGRKNRTVRLEEFVEATSFFGLEAHQAAYFFGIMDSDGNGELTLDEFMEALTSMPRHVLLQDFRQRLLARHASIQSAFSHIAKSVGGASGSARLDRSGFIVALSRLSIPELEAVELFRIIDDDNSGCVSMTELRDALRDVSPSTTLDEFWQRFNAEWPEMAATAGAKDFKSRYKMEGLLAAIVPAHLQEECQAPMARGSPDRPGILSLEAFHAIASLLDISSGNAGELFKGVVSASAWQGRMPQLPTAVEEEDQHLGHVPGQIECEEHDRKEERRGAIIPKGVNITQVHELGENAVYVEDFMDLLQFWIANPALSNREMLRVVDPAKAMISALKTELSITKDKDIGSSARKASPPAAAKGRRDSLNSRKIPKLPWCSYR